MSDAIKSPKVNAESVCERARTAIRYHILTNENCTWGLDEYGMDFVFRFSKWTGNEWNRETFSVCREMIEDGIMSEQRLKAALWHTLGKLRGMV